MPDPWGPTNFYPPLFFPVGSFHSYARETCATYVLRNLQISRSIQFWRHVFIDAEAGYGACEPRRSHRQLEWDLGIRRLPLGESCLPHQA
ncbi:MAG: hypothetical protein Ct9H90mP25_0310 [Gammaproteobacteria bacterium]|nr:MAG: hypothetical protein Ct9H90mP25_0310 [Gammaproteobacteria bacterium]